MDWLTAREKKIFLTVFLIMAVFTQWYGVNANARFDLTRSIVDYGTVTINEVYENAGDRSYYEGDYYSDKEPGMAFLALPIYAAWKGVYGLVGNATVDPGDRRVMFTANNVDITYPATPGPFYLSALILVILLTSTLALSLLTILVYRISGEFLTDERKRLVVTFGFAFGTLVTHYGTMFLPNAVVTFLSFLSFYLIYRSKGYPGARHMTAAGVIGGFAVVVDPTAAPIVLGTFLYTGLRFRQVPLRYVAGGFIGVLPLLVYNTALFGYPWMLPRFFLDPALYPNLQQAASTVPQLTDQGFRLEPVKLFFVSLRLLVFPHRGIFYWFPFLLLALLGATTFFQEKRDMAVAMTISGLLLIAMVAGWWAWWMGGFFGARYLAVLIPFLMFPVFYAARSLDTRLLAVVVAASILVNLAGYHGTYEDQLKNLQNSSEMKEQYQQKVRSFQPLANPVKDYYLAGLAKHGPQSRILNGLYNGDFPPDIRAYSPYEERAPLLLLAWVLALIPVLVWRREIADALKNHRERVLT